MINIDKHLTELENKRQILIWLINGSGIHCLPISSVAYLTKERICQLYNMNMDDFDKL